MSYPNTLDVFANPGPTTNMDDPGYEGDVLMTQVQDAVEAVENRTGAIATAGTEQDYVLFGNAAGASYAEPLGRPNDLINGRFDLWPAATSITVDGWLAGLWYAKRGSGGAPAFTVSRQAHALNDVVGEPRYFVRFSQTAQATSVPPTLEQPLPGVRRRANSQVTVSFWAACSSGTVVVTPRFRQVFGTGGSPSAEVDTDGSAITVTTTRQRFVRTLIVPSLSGKTIGTTADTDYVSLQLRFPLSSTYTVDIDQIKLEPGATASAFEPGSAEEEQRRLDLYFERVLGWATNAVVWQGAAVNTNDVRFLATFAKKWKVVPTSGITFSANADFSVLNNTFTAADSGTLSTASAGPDRAQCRMNTIGAGVTLTTGDIVYVRFNSTSAYMDVDARIVP